MSKEDLISLLEECRINNQKENLTGMLLYRDRYFIQVLEGEEAVVDALYAKINQDPRHGNVLMVEKSSIETRSFGDWSMGFSNLDEADPQKYPGLTTFLTQPVVPSHFQDNPSRAKELILLFKGQVHY